MASSFENEGMDGPLPRSSLITGERVAIAAAGAILFVSIGTRQGFGLFHAATEMDLGMDRSSFARSIAIQYLVWGFAGPAAAVLAVRFSSCATLIGGGVLYTAGYLVAATARSEAQWLFGAGLLVGLGIGGASFAVVNGAVVGAVSVHRRGLALGLVAGMTALGQLLLVFYTEATLAALGWRGALLAHGAVTFTIVPLALWLHAHAGRGPSPPIAPEGWLSIAAAVGQRDFWLLGIGFALSGFHVMFTMTHLPAWSHDIGFAPAVAVQALAAVGATSFLGSILIGGLCDRVAPARLLVALYVARSVLAALAAVLSFTPASFVVYFAVLGCVWMATIPVTSHLAARRFGAARLALVYGVVFMLHQVGGFAGTWLGGVVFDRHGSYQLMWQLIASLSLLGSVLALPLIDTASRPLRSPSPP